jgi:DNA-binding CsgD family transcriptional regulator
MLQSGYMSVMEARSQEEFRSEIVRFSHGLGFDTVSAITVIDRPLSNPEFIAVDNAPEGYWDAMEASTKQRRDPVMQHCKQHSIPIIWNQDTYTSSGAADIWENRPDTAIAPVFAWPLQKVDTCAETVRKPMPKDPSELTRMVADLQLFAVHAQDAALRILVPAAAQPERPQLTPRELECLRWTMDGKTAWEVGEILGISERTAVLHLNNGMHKLDCTNKHQAVLKALRLGLIR